MYIELIEAVGEIDLELANIAKSQAFRNSWEKVVLDYHRIGLCSKFPNL
jgi:hypothetical protein